ncbi:shikimate kinase [Brachybacterium saurashtrense]|uniref:Shikimate kinase n=1 Tax=Brachybacterium saurashtrense TaxID=556288 RepID=A0A345YM82_9MICO|nr:shikimate kinase [Brachybacterium saurashtrense]AXK45034.1 shikimate kinase [Brachybacterium saurashtrense]RRR21718.1 shikimate kinase [Brachybacterium saurashtrense]
MTGPLAILIGPMAAGKTSVGRALASRLGVPFADLDALIVEADGRSIEEIFAAEGEPGFRALEAATLAEALTAQEGVLSLGGGAPLHPESRERLRGAPVIWLDVDEQVAARRLGQGAGRPMLDGGDPMARWRALAHERGPRYRELAALRIDSGHGSPARVARAILAALQLEHTTSREKEHP